MYCALLQVLMAHLQAIFRPDQLSALPVSANNRYQQQRLPGMPQTVAALPATAKKQEWQAYIATLPDTDTPDVFGLPANIERAVALGNSKRLLVALQQMGTAQAAAASSDRQLWAAQLQPLLKLWDQLVSLLPPGLRPLVLQHSRSTSGRPGSARAQASAAPAASNAAVCAVDVEGGSPVSTFVALEQALGLALLKEIDGVMAGIKAVVGGETATSASVQVNCLLACSLPQIQSKASSLFNWNVSQLCVPCSLHAIGNLNYSIHFTYQICTWCSDACCVC